MDPANSYLGRLLLEEITPVVMVLSTPLAEEACRKNGLNLVEMLLPFSLFNKIDVPVRTASDQPYRLQRFKLRLVYASDIRQQSYQAADEHLKQVVHDANEKSPPDLFSDSPELETLVSGSESDVRPAWIETFNKELMRSVSFSEHEAFDHPVACLLVVSSKDERPINKFVELFNADNLPSLLNDGSMDPKILKHYLILHDVQDGVADRAANVLAEMRGTFGSNSCKLLCINSDDGGNSETKDIPWVPYGSGALFSDDVAHFLTTVDLSAIKDFMQDLCCNHLIPHMEQKIRVLNQQVSATRKGFKNQIKNLWWRKGKDDVPEAPSGSAYVFSSIESQIRVLGDYAFMLRDYELALSNYRLLSTDYKLDKAWKRYAGVQEMSGLSYFMLDQSRKEAEYCMENAFTTYLKLGSSGQRNAARCGLWWAEMLKDRGQFRDAASIYSRIAVEEPSMHAAIMFEQASHCYLFSSPPMLRKYGFYLVLAGNRYYISNERQHAIRVYKSALLVYKEKGWNYIADHVHFNIGRWYAYLGIFEVAVKHMLEVLACSHQSVGTQKLFLNDFFHVVKSTGKRFEVQKLQLPVIDMLSLKVMYQDHRTYSSSSDQVLVNESLWQTLEEEMVPSVPTIKSNWLDAEPRSSSLKKYKDYCICVAGEIIKVDLEFKNPLQVPISVSSVSLICELSARSETGKADLGASSFEEDKELTTHPSLKDLPDDDSYFIVTKLDVVLQGLETKKLQLEVSPKVEGMLTIIGVKWTLSESVVGYEYFEFSAKKKQKKKRQDIHTSNRVLHFVVIKELPKLDGYIHGLANEVFAGDLRHLELELRNPSKHPVKNVKMKISHPRFLIPGSTGDKILNFPECLYKQSSDSKDISADPILNSKSLLFAFPNNTTVQGESTLTWPLWLHASVSGKITLYLSIYYEVESSSSSMTYRVLRMRHDIEVLPALDVSFLVTPCYSRLQEFVVRMDILNRTVSSNIHLSQLSCLGDGWQISTSTSNFPSQTLNSGQAMSCFFKLKSCRSDPNSENLFQVSDLIIGCDVSKDILVDVSKSPVAEFHQYERYHQGKSGKVGSGIVDFILTSRLCGKNSADEHETLDTLLSNHTCHCSITSKAPITWLMDGPRIINHNFSSSFCEASILLKIHNCSDAVVVVRVTTFDVTSAGNQSADSDSSGSDGVWHDISLGDDIKAISNVQGSWPKKSATVGAASPVVWSSTSSTKLKLEPSCAVEVPLQICIFTPGTYDLSNYELQWRVKPSDDSQALEAKKWTSGSSQGHPFYLTVLQALH